MCVDCDCSLRHKMTDVEYEEYERSVCEDTVSGRLNQNTICDELKVILVSSYFVPQSAPESSETLLENPLENPDPTQKFKAFVRGITRGSRGIALSSFGLILRHLLLLTPEHISFKLQHINFFRTYILLTRELLGQKVCIRKYCDDVNTEPQCILHLAAQKGYEYVEVLITNYD